MRFLNYQKIEKREVESRQGLERLTEGFKASADSKR